MRRYFDGDLNFWFSSGDPGLLSDWPLRTWLDDDGASAPLLPVFAVAPGAEPAFGVSLHHNHAGDHFPEQQVELLHVVVPEENLPAHSAWIRPSQHLLLILQGHRDFFLTVYLCRSQHPVFHFSPLQYGNNILLAALWHLVGSKCKVIISMRGDRRENQEKCHMAFKSWWCNVVKNGLFRLDYFPLGPLGRHSGKDSWKTRACSYLTCHYGLQEGPSRHTEGEDEARARPDCTRWVCPIPHCFNAFDI